MEMRERSTEWGREWGSAQRRIPVITALRVIAVIVPKMGSCVSCFTVCQMLSQASLTFDLDYMK